MSIKLQITKQGDPRHVLEVKGREGSPYLVFDGRTRMYKNERRWVKFLRKLGHSARKLLLDD